MPASAYKMSSRNRTRRAFSLAEIMIAIGILGVGMLMVAATFPVGLDQSRIVTEQTIAPLVANDAFERLRLLLDEPSFLKRIPHDATAPDFTDPTTWRSFREALEQIAIQQLDGSSQELLRSHLSNGKPAEDPALSEVSPPYRWTGLNELLVAPYIPPTTPGMPPRNGGAGTRFYPAVAAKRGSETWPYNWTLALRSDAAGQPSLVEPPYTWSALYRVHSVTSPVVSHSVQFVVFVNRRGSEWPSDWPKPVNLLTQGAIIEPVPSEVWLPPNYTSTSGVSNRRLIAEFSEGGFLVQSDGVICRIKQILRAKDLTNSTADPSNPDGCHRIVLDGISSPIVWFIPADPATGRSPCIGVYSRVFPM